ncbi:restriction endonuclease subunit S [Streptomyces bacillaris]|uniref:restriction endonuclease subunit S n=1 Tax=Streptomyces bacillaris TaxID=68179 RepID=UPI0036470C3C
MTVIPWLGDVRFPVIAAKRVYSIVLGKMLQPSPSDARDVEVSYFKSSSVQWGGVNADPGIRMWASAREMEDLAVRKGDLLVCEGGDVGRCAIYDGPGGFIFQNSIHRVRSRQGGDVRYFRYVLEALHGSSWLDVLCNKATIRHLTGEKLGSLEVPHPEEYMQRQIADYLDAEVQRFDLVAQKRSEQSSLLQFHRAGALARVFDQAASSVPTRLKYLMRKKPRYGVLVPEFVDDGAPFVRVNDLLDLRGRSATLVRIPESLSQQYARTRVQANDILLGVVGTLGRAALAPVELEGANIARAVASLRVRHDVDPGLIVRWIETADFMRQALEATGNDTAQPTLGMEDLANFKLRWPTDAHEQRRLAQEVEEVAKHHDELTACYEKQTRLLTERRRALITAAVTGQIDVTTARGVRVP